MTSDRPRIVATRRIYEGWNRFDIVTVEAPDKEGALCRHDREVVDHGNAAVVLLTDRRRGVAILVRQWRIGRLAAGEDPFLLEACAGIVDPGETPEDAARREAEEETGLKVGALRSLGSILSSPGTLTERMHLFLAEVTAGEGAAGGGNPREGEDIEVVEVPLVELYAMARRGEVEDAKTLVIVQRLMVEELESGISRTTLSARPD
jgi:nudix-type nucleoside diphosphatase (YffH/AdpP family)